MTADKLMSFEDNGIFVRATMDSIGRMVSYDTAIGLLRKYPGVYEVNYFGLTLTDVEVNLQLLGLDSPVHNE
jgi:hypothetical protein